MVEGRERRKKQRIQLTRALIGRFGVMGVVILDITDAGARIEHFDRLDLRKKASFRLDWQQQTIETTAEVRSCRIHRGGTMPSCEDPAGRSARFSRRHR